MTDWTIGLYFFLVIHAVLLFLMAAPLVPRTWDGGMIRVTVALMVAAAEQFVGHHLPRVQIGSGENGDDAHLTGARVSPASACTGPFRVSGLRVLTPTDSG